jgi:hypothetical protein
MIQGTVVKDSQNPYRTGVLVGNHVEDRFGQDLIAQDVGFRRLCGENSIK